MSKCALPIADASDASCCEGLLLGFPLDDFASMLEREAREARSLLNRLADILVQEAAKDMKRSGIQEQVLSNDDDEKQSTLVKSQNLLKQFSLPSGWNSSSDEGRHAHRRRLFQTFGRCSCKSRNGIRRRRSASI